MRNRFVLRAIVSIIALFLFSLILGGCAESTTDKVYSDSHFLKKEMTDLNVPTEKDCRYFSIIGDDVYYVIYSDGSSNIDVCKIEVETQKKEILSTFSGGTFLSYASAESSSGGNLYLLSMDLESFFIYQVSSDGRLESVIEKECDFEGDGYPRFLMVDDDYFYVVFSNCFLIINKDGTGYRTEKYESMMFESGVINQNGELVFTLLSNYGQRYLTKYLAETSVFTEKAELKNSIVQLAKVGDTLYVLQSGGIYEVNVDTLALKKIVDLDYHGISATEVQSFSFINDAFYLVIKDFSEKKATTKIAKISDVQNIQTKAVIKVFCTDNGADDLTSIELLKSYNEQSSEYTAELVENNGPFDAVFLQEEKPDVIYFYNQDTAMRYIKDGFCDNLVSFIDESNELSIDEMNSKVFQVFGKGDKLYAVPTAISAKSILVPARTRIGNNGWTVSEYLSWLTENPDACALGGMTKQKILEDCLYGVLEEFIDKNNASVSFDTDEFVQILKRIHNLPQMHNEESIYISTALAGKYDYKSMKYLKREIVQSVFELAQKECCLGDDFVYVGYPNSEKERIARVECNSIFSIFSEAENKHGAYDFIEFALKYQYIRTVENWEGTSSGKMWAINSFAERDLAKAIGEFDIVSSGKGAYSSDLEFKINSTENDVGIFCEVINNSKPLYSYEKKIIDIILEETEPFFDGQKTVEEVCSVIQSRSMIVIQENVNY